MDLHFSYVAPLRPLLILRKYLLGTVTLRRGWYAGEANLLVKLAVMFSCSILVLVVLELAITCPVEEEMLSSLFFLSGIYSSHAPAVHCMSATVADRMP